MANNNVKFFKVNLLDTYLKLATKDENALYWVAENQTLYLGGKMYGTGQLASENAKGLLSAEDYISLKALIASSGLTAVDGTISITDVDGGRSIGVAIAPIEGNALVAVDGGLFVPATSIKLADNAHGLVTVDGALALNLATKDSDGAISKEDKVFIDALKELNISSEYATKEEIQSIRESVAQVEQAYSWEDM